MLRFLCSALGLGLVALTAAGGLGAAAVARFLWPNTRREPASRFLVGRLADYPPGWVETRFKETHGVWVVHGVYRGQRQIYALSTACTHLGCITLWASSDNRFKCPCHGSGFSADGLNREGPAPRPLERFAIRLTDAGQLEVDTARRFRQERGQWNDPASFVASGQWLGTGGWGLGTGGSGLGDIDTARCGGGIVGQVVSLVDSTVDKLD